MRKYPQLIITLIILLPLVFSNTILIEQVITEDFEILNNITVFLRENNIILTFNKEILDLKILENEERIMCKTFEKYSIVCETKNITHLPLSFKIFTQFEKIKNNRYEIKLLTKAEKFYFSIYLPIGYIVKESREEIPNNVTTLSDGKRIMLFFRKENVTTFETYFTLKQVEKIIPFPYSIITLILAASIIIVTILYIYYKIKVERERKRIMEMLNPNERKVLEILFKIPKITQKKLVEFTQLSKAEISKIISSLKQRNVIDVERRGRNNIIRLKKKI